LVPLAPRPSLCLKMRQFAVILYFMAAASSSSASPQNLGDRIREGIMKAKEGLEGAGIDIGRAIADTPLAERLNALKKEFPLSTICDGEEPTSCTCDRREEPLEGPFTFDNLEEIVKECLPNICTCADGSERKTLTRVRPLLDMKEMCGGKLPESCTCDDGESRVELDGEMPFPAMLKAVMKDCKPRSCLCEEGAEEVPFTTFGCAAGGPPNCISEGEKGKLLCDGEVLSLKKLAKARASGECVCDNGVTPVCSNTEDIPKCWDGSSPDPDLGGISQDHLKKCSPPE